MRAICLNCTLKRSPEESSGASLSDVVMSALREEGVETDAIRLVDHRIEPGVVSEAVGEGDEWPAIRERILAAAVSSCGVGDMSSRGTRAVMAGGKADLKRAVARARP
jgi:hypothetical protein